MQTRIERDCLGELELPADAYWGIVTERNRLAFDVSAHTLDEFPQYIRAVALIKIACARANASIGALDPVKAEAICRAAREVADGRFAGQFPVNILRGSGTPINMNVNEVVAHRANEILTGSRTKGGVHPNTHVNMGQSTNDLIPSAKEIVVHDCLDKVIGASERFAAVLRAKAAEFSDVVKLGRTCMQDALPVRLGQEFAGYASGIERLHTRLVSEQAHWNRSSLGGTAVGTGLGCMPGFREAVHRELSAVLGRTIEPDADLFDSMAATDSILIAHATVQALSTQVWRIARDLRIMASGPRGGLGEITLPAVAPGSSIMPGKLNPVIAEMVFTTSAQIDGNQEGLSMGVKSGWLELGGSSAVPIRSMINSCDLLARTMDCFAERCVAGISANREQCYRQAERSLALATVVSTLFGYETGVKIAHDAAENDLSVKEAARRSGLIPESAIEELFDLQTLTDPERVQALFAKYASLRNVDSAIKE